MQKPPVHARLTTLMLCIGLIQVAAYYVSGMTAGLDGELAVPQPDTLLYCQAARRIAEGHPLSFAAGSAVSTGTTSVLYPFVLAVPYALGAKGASLLLAGFLLNAAFYLVFLAGWSRAIREWLESPLSRLVAGLLVALSCQPAFCAMAQSDIGIWLAASGLLAAALASRSRPLYAALLVLGPWIRPEGMVVVIAFGAFYVASLVAPRARLDAEGRRALDPARDGLVLALAVASMVGVFALNYALTGQAQFSSVANKGYFKVQPFAAAVVSTARAFLSVARSHVLGLSVSMPDEMFLFPLLSGCLVLLGAFVRPWRKFGVAGLPLVMLAALGGAATVAMSGWQGSNFDRYLAWTVPLVAILLAEGLSFLCERLAGAGRLRHLPAVVTVLFSAGASAAAVCMFHLGSAGCDIARRFAEDVDAKIPKTASFGAFGGCGSAYWLGDRPFKHVLGIYSPEFRVTSDRAALEALKNDPSLRFDYWLLAPDTATVFGGESKIVGEVAVSGPNGMEVRKADWSAFDRAARTSAAPEGKSLVCRVDVGYEEDERNFRYEVIDRYSRRPAEPFVRIAELEGTNAIDVCRVVVGGDAMTVPLAPGRDATVVMRTYPRHVFELPGNHAGKTECEFANPMTLNVAVDGQLVEPAKFSFAKEGFSDVTFTIPGSAIATSPCTVSFLGDHVAGCYWFYQ